MNRDSFQDSGQHCVGCRAAAVERSSAQMSLDMLDASFMARRGVLRAQRTPYDAQFAVVLLLPRSDRPTQSPAGQTESVSPRPPPAQPSHGPTASFSQLPRQIPARRVRNERPSRTRVGDRGAQCLPGRAQPPSPGTVTENQTHGGEILDTNKPMNSPPALTSASRGSAAAAALCYNPDPHLAERRACTSPP